MSLLYHMTSDAQWSRDEPYHPPTYEQDGFTHLTADPQLLLTVANHFYVDAPGNWIVLVIDSSRLAAPVKYEPAAPVGDKSSQGLLGAQEDQEQQQAEAEQQQQQEGEGPLFPHLYGALNPDAVVRQLPMRRAADGTFLAIEGLP